MANRWLRTTLGELCDQGIAELQTGPFGTQLHAHDYVAEGVPVVPTESLRNRRIDHALLPRITVAKADELARHRLRCGDILFARRGVQATGHIGFVRAAEEGFICGTGAIRLRIGDPNPAVDASFLSHVLAEPTSVDWFKFHAIGATMPNLNEQIIKSFALNLPDLHEQRAIGRVLDALDDKIEMNRRLKHTLQEVAEALYRSWFVDFDPVRANAARTAGLPDPLADLFPDSFEESELGEIPTGWRVVRLADPAVFPLVAPGVEADATAVVRYIATGDVQGDQINGETESALGLLPSRANMQPGSGRVWFAKMKDSPKRLWTMAEDQEWWSDCVLSTGFAGLQASAKEHESLLYCFISSRSFEESKNQLATGTTMQALNNDTLGTIGLVLPDVPVAVAFDRLTRPIYRRIWQSNLESRTVAHLQIELRHGLITGRVRLARAPGVVADSTS